MNQLNLSRVNAHSPYKLEVEGDSYLFYTDYDILYSVTFDKEEGINYPAYWFNLTNLSGMNSPRDRKIQYTVICIIEEFFRSNEDVLLYMCDTADNQQSMRARLFMRWFESYESKERYITRSAVVVTENQPDYIVLIVERSHPHAELITELFDAEIAAFRQYKP